MKFLYVNFPSFRIDRANACLRIILISCIFKFYFWSFVFIETRISINILCSRERYLWASKNILIVKRKTLSMLIQNERRYTDLRNTVYTYIYVKFWDEHEQICFEVYTRKYILCLSEMQSKIAGRREKDIEKRYLLNIKTLYNPNDKYNIIMRKWLLFLKNEMMSNKCNLFFFFFFFLE